MVFHRLDSSNRRALESLESLDHGDVVEADRQTEGRGRQSKPWFAAENRGLALSFVLKDVSDLESAPMLGQAAALAVRDVLDSLGIQAMLKWPNDVLVGDRKICGILLESDIPRNAVVVGIGVNVNATSDDFRRHHLEGIATSIRLLSGSVQEKAEVRRRLVLALERWLDAFFRTGPPSVVDAWKTSDWLEGCTVRVSTEEKDIRGIYAGLDARGRLVLEDASGVERRFWSGDVARVHAVPEARPRSRR